LPTINPILRVTKQDSFEK